MGGGSQTILTIGALALLSVFAISVNHSIILFQTATFESRVTIAAVAEAKNLLEEIGSKSFDQATVPPPPEGKKVKRKGPPPGKGPADFTPPGLLKKEAGEEYPFFNDIDDYNGFMENKANPTFGAVAMKVAVVYVDPSRSNDETIVATSAKRVDIWLTVGSLKDTIRIRKVFYQ
jgi:hypothetical protein